MKIGIIGPGAMGCLLAAYLAKAGQEVILLDHQAERAAFINRKGLKIEGIRGSVRMMVPATLEPEKLSGSQLIVLCVKAYDTRTVVESIGNLGSGPLWLTLQNGVGNVEILEEYLFRENILAGITSHGATLLGPGRIRHAGEGDTFIGYAFPGKKGQAKKEEDLLAISRILEAAGFKTQIVGQIENLIWTKLLVNVGINALTALTRLPNGALLDYLETEEILEEAVREAIEVGRAKAVAFTYPDPLERVKKVCRMTQSNISSMLQDILKEKRTEIDFINGVIVREGRKRNIPVPVNTVLTLLVKTLEKSFSQRIRQAQSLEI